MTKKLNATTAGHDIDPQPYRPQSDPKIAAGPGPRLAGASELGLRAYRGALPPVGRSQSVGS